MALPLPVVPRSLRYAAVTIVCGIIFYFSILAIPPDTPAPDSVALPTWRHFLAYFVLGLSIAYALTDRPIPRRRKALLVLVLATGFGAFIELGQAFVPERHASLADVLINAASVSVSLCWYLIEPYADHVAVTSLVD